MCTLKRILQKTFNHLKQSAQNFAKYVATLYLNKTPILRSSTKTGFFGCNHRNDNYI